MAKARKLRTYPIGREVTDYVRAALPSLLEREESVASAKFAMDYLFKSFLSKYTDTDKASAAARRHSAIVKWLGVEQRNRRTNSRLYSTDPFFLGLGYGHDVLVKASKLIARTIGVTPPEDLLLKGSFSKGASTSLRRDVGTFAKKFIGKRDATPSAWGRLSKVLPEFPVWALENQELLAPRLVKGNVLFTVPKTDVIDRVACKEPDYNVFGQKAIGDYFSRKLRKRGIDLNDQSINRSLAREGSITGKLSTIDLSSASDSLSISLVSLLLPKAWFDLLCDFRCPKTFIDGKSHVNEMFSSMGNGFTFELESLVFWAIAWSIRDKTKALGRISVYGDDIIVPSSMAGVLISFLSWVGFRTNVQKTFVRGPFRESCGGHYFRGLDVTPFYLKRPIKNVSDLILFLNQYRAWLIRTGFDALGNGYEEPNSFTLLWESLKSLVPRSLYGGWDLSSRSQLVSPDPANCELVAAHRDRDDLTHSLGAGLYLSRLSGYDRSVLEDKPDFLSELEDSMELLESKLVQPTGGFEIRRCRFEPLVFGLARPLFTYEQAGASMGWEPKRPRGR